MRCPTGSKTKSLVVSAIVLIPVGAGEADGLMADFCCAEDVCDVKRDDSRWLTTPPQTKTINSNKRQMVGEDLTVWVRDKAESDFTAKLVLDEISRSKSLSILARRDERFHHFRGDVVAVELIQFVQPELVAGMIGVGSVIGVAAQIT